MYFIGILEAKLIAFATQILTSKFQVKVQLGLVQTNIFGVILCNLHNVICSYCFCSSLFITYMIGLASVKCDVSGIRYSF